MSEEIQGLKDRITKLEYENRNLVIRLKAVLEGHIFHSRACDGWLATLKGGSEEWHKSKAKALKAVRESYGIEENPS